MTKLAKNHMPGWVSHGNVQINVGRDLHIHGGASFEPDYAPQHDVGTRVVGAFARVGTALWWTLKATYYLAYGLLSLAAWLTFSALAIALWVVGRIGDLLRGAESLAGGAPGHLIYVPSVLQRNEVLPALTAGDRINEVRSLKGDYDHAN